MIKLESIQEKLLESIQEKLIIPLSKGFYKIVIVKLGRRL